jgi:hypothetical protein
MNLNSRIALLRLADALARLGIAFYLSNSWDSAHYSNPSN